MGKPKNIKNAKSKSVSLCNAVRLTLKDIKLSKQKHKLKGQKYTQNIVKNSYTVIIAKYFVFAGTKIGYLYPWFSLKTSLGSSVPRFSEFS